MKKVLLKELLKQPELVLSFKNLTSETPAKSDIRLISVGDSSCTVEIPSKSCALGHQLFISFSMQQPDEKKLQKKQHIQVIGKVVELNPIDEHRVEIVITFS